MNKIKNFIFDHFEGALIILIIIGVVAIAFLVYYKSSFLHFFFLPVILSGYFLGKKRAVLTGIFCILLFTLYLLFFPLFSIQREKILLDEIINLTVWGCFLILSGYIVGSLSEKSESKLKHLGQAYVGGLEIMLKYLEVADEKIPRSLRVSRLAGKIAQAAGLKISEVENIKSAALLLEAGDLQVSLPFFHEAADFVASKKEIDQTGIENREKVVLTSAASLLKAIEPVLAGYFHHYVEGADFIDKDFAEVPLGSSIIAIANVYDEITSQVSPQEGEGIRKWEDIEKLSGRTFPAIIVNALREVTQTP